MSLRTRLVLSFTLLAFFAVGLSMGVSFYNYRNQLRSDLKQRLLNIVSLAALQQNGDLFLTVQSANDLPYDQIRLQNTAIKDSDPEIRFVYTMRYDAQGIYFVVDAGQITDVGFSPYGTRYQNPGPILAANYSTMDHPMVEPNTYQDEYGSFLSAYAPFYTADHKLAGIIAVDISANNIVSNENRALVWHLSAFLISLPLVAIAGWFLGTALTAPITALTQVALRISEGDLGYRPAIRANSPEIASLGQAFYSMADQLHGLISELENRVAERTKVLERRAVQLQAAADVGAAVSRLHDLDELLKQVARLISLRFNFYHVGVFLLDEMKEYAVLRATNSEGGLRMLERGHKLKVGQVGIVGYVTNTGQPRIALDVGQDAVFFDNPDLPQTRSEMALPLISGGKILGALDVQSAQGAAFTEEDVKTLKVLAGQISIAIENARLFEENQASIETARRILGESSLEGWQNLLAEKKTKFGYISIAEGQVAPVSGETGPEFVQSIETGQLILSADGTTIYLPIVAQGKVIGAIRLDKPQDGGQWTDEDINVANILTEQLGNALESAKLYEEIVDRSQRQQMIGAVTARIRETLDLDTVLQTAVHEIQKSFNLKDAEIRLQTTAAEPGPSRD
jgi:GAF domain-containing protein/HAMP domain-containing protein